MDQFISLAKRTPAVTATMEPEVISRWLSGDPLRQYASPYVGMGNDPVNRVDPDGAFSYSTDVDKDGNVVNVFNDGDLNIYRVDNNGNRTGEIIGQTKYWDEFINPETGLVQGFINEGATWDNIINTLHEDAKGLNLVTVALGSSPGGPYDIKHPVNGYTNNPFEGRLLNGNYARV